MRPLFSGKLGHPRRIAAWAVLLGSLMTAGYSRNPALTAAPAAPVPNSDLAFVPADAVAFGHVHLAEVWKSDLMATFRASVEKAGPKALAALDEQLMPTPSSFDRLTGFVIFTQHGPQPFGILSFNRAVEPDALVKHYMPAFKVKKLGDKSLYVCEQCGAAAYFPSDRQVMMGTPAGLEGYLARPVAAEGSLKAALELASTRPLVLAGNIAALPIPPQAFRELPPEVVPALKAQTATLSVQLTGDPQIHLTASYKDADGAAKAEQSLEFLKKLAKAETAKLRATLEALLFDPKHKTPRPADEYPAVVTSVLGLGAMNRLDEMIDNPGIKRDGVSLAWSVTVPKEMTGMVGTYSAVSVGLLLPAVQNVRQAAARAQSQNNLKQLMIALHNYHDSHNHFPSDIKDKNGKALLSWRVAILPFIEQQALYQQFKLDEPWDSEHNKRASQVAVRVFMSPNAVNGPLTPEGYGLTNYVGVAGPGTMFDPKGKIKITDITDGTSNTVTLIETPNAIPWAKPGDFEFDPKKPLPQFRFPGSDIFNAAFGDGSVRSISKTVPEKTLKALFTRNGGEVVEGP